MLLLRSPALWSGFRGTNTSALYFLATAPSDPVGYLPTAYSDAWTASGLPSGGLAAMAALGFDHVRLACNIAPILQANSLGLTSRANAYIAGLVPIVRACVNAGLAVNLDLHVSPSDATWGPQVVTASLSLNGAKWANWRAVAASVAATLQANFLPQQVCIDLMNEPPGDAAVPGLTAYWPTMAYDLYSAARSQASGLTLIVPGSDLGAFYALCGSAFSPANAGYAGLDPSAYDSNVLFTFHAYDPINFSHCGYQGFAPASTGLYVKYFDAIPFPFDTNGIPNASDLTAAVSTMTANVNADGSLTSGQKTSYIAAATSALTNMFETQSSTYLANYVAGTLRCVAKWADANAVDRSRIYVGEFGCFRGTQGVTQAGRDAFYLLVRTTLESQNHRWTSYNWDGDGFAMQSGDSVLSSTRAALGLN